MAWLVPEFRCALRKSQGHCEELAKRKRRMEDRFWFVNDDDLTLAIGKVVRESALMDELLRELIGDLLGEASDVVWILFEGQTSEWLATTPKELLKLVDPVNRKWAKEEHEKLISIIGELGLLRRLRNAVVHGVWLRDPIAYEEWAGRPWGNVSDGTPIYYCFRSKQRDEPEVRELSIRDVEAIAEKYADVRVRVVAHFRSMMNAIGYRWDVTPLPRW
ncbi:hypothetical protein ACFU3E_00340 [Streptomyces sp. NPDC057424]|uniref:hypothetical protein n=1 Tax=Streptomyces sp. NPDC057424 TaxID=3346127 RepID=UPI003677C0F1